MYLTDLCIKRPVLTIILSSVFIIFGIIGYQRIPFDEYPYIEFPYVTVTTFLSGASPEVIDMDITDVLEEEFNSIQGIKHITSVSMMNKSVITLEFHLDKDINVAATDVQNKIGMAMKKLPKDVDRPIVDKLSTESIATVWFTLQSKTRSFNEICMFADQVLRRRLETVSGVGKVNIYGFRDREIQLWLDREKLNSYHIPPQKVVQALKDQHIEMPGGFLKTGPTEIIVKTMGEFKSVEEFNDLIIDHKNGVPIKLKDIGYAEDGMEEERSLMRYNKQPAVGIQILKQVGSNVVEVAERLKKKIKELEPLIPEGMEYTVSWDRSKFIRSTIEGVQVDLLVGVVLTIVILYIFLLNFRSTLIVNLAIPTSIIGAFAAMYFLGFTANNMTMIALSVAIGLVVDDAIIILENIYRHMEEGMDPIEAASSGTSEIAFAAIIASLSICVVFIPVAFMKGIMGRFLYPFGLTIVSAIMISLFVALTLTPMLCSRILKLKNSKEDKKKNLFHQFVESVLNSVTVVYSVMLGFALRHRVVMLFCVAGVFTATVFLGLQLKKEFLPMEDRGLYMISMRTPVGSSIEYTKQFIERLENVTAQEPENTMITSMVGAMPTDDTNNVWFFVVMEDLDKRTRSQKEVMAMVQKNSSTIPGVVISVEDFSAIGRISRNTDVDGIIRGPDMNKLAKYAEDIKTQYAKIPGIVGVDYDLELEKPETRIYIDRDKAADVGVDISTIAKTLWILIDGYADESIKFEDEGERYNIRVRLMEKYRTRPEDLMNILVPAKNGNLIELRNLVHIENGVSPQTIRRFERQHAIHIFANARGGNKTAGEAIDDLKEIAKQVLPKEGGYELSFGGTSEDMIEMFDALTFAFILAIIVVYMLLAAQFESFIHPFTILLALPMALFGAFGALLITGKTLNLFSLLGMIILIGLVTKNAILLVDYINTLRKRGLSRTDAILKAGPVRLRPVLMTALSTFFGMLPIALELSEGGEARSPMAIAVGSGMITSTILTLLMIPVIYSLLDDLVIFVQNNMVVFVKKFSEFQEKIGSKD